MNGIKLRLAVNREDLGDVVNACTGTELKTKRA